MILTVCPNPSVDTYWWMDGIKNSEVNRIIKQEPYPGGKGVHVAFNVAELGQKSILMGIWAGNKGKWIKEQCTALNVLCDGIEVEGDNRTCISVLSNNEAIKNTEFLETGPSINEKQVTEFVECYKKNLPKSKLVILSGSWMLGAPADAYGIFIDEANKMNIPVWIDCSGELLKQSLRHKPFGVHVNKSEALALCSNETDIEKYFLAYVQQLALTVGKEGLYFYTNTEKTHAVCTVEKVKSTVGCGDALLAGIAIATVKKYGFKNIAKYGAACGAANCLRHELGMLYKDDVEALYAACK
jgi:tagatose 6-phosphate kinase